MGDTGVLGMGITFEIRDAFSQQAGNIGKALGWIQSQAKKMAESVSSLMRSSVNDSASAVVDAQGRLRDAQGRFLSIGSKAYLDAIKNGAIDMEKALSDSMAKLQNSAMGLFAGLAALSPFGLAINKAREFEQQLSNIKSLGVTGEKMQQVEKLAMEMGAKTKFSAFEAAQGIEELLKAGVSLEKVMDKNGLSGALDLAVAGGLKLADAAEIASTALNAFRADNLTIRDAGNILAGAANASATDVMTLRFSLQAVSAVASGVGLSFLDTSKALAIFANNGLKGSDAGTSLKAMLMNLQPRTKEQIATFQKLGLMTAQGANAFYDAKGQIKSMAEIAGLLSNSLKNLTPQQRSFALETMFGSDAVRAGNILYKEGAKGINDMQKEMTKFTAASVAKERLNNFNGSIEMLMGSIDTILIQVGQIFLPMLTRLVQVVNLVADAFQSLISTNIGRYMVVAAAAVTSFVVVFGAVIPFIQTAIGVMKVMGIVAWQTAAAFAPYLAIAGVLIFAFKAFASFKDVLEGTVKPAQGLLGFMQKLGAVIWTVGQVLSSWDGKTFDLGGNEAQLQALGMLDSMKALGTYIVRFTELFKGIGTGIYEVFAGVGNAVFYVAGIVMQGVNAIMRAFGMQDARMKYSSSNIQTWISVGKVLGYVIGTVLVVATISLTASLASMAIAVVAATWPILAVIAAIGAVVAVFYYWDDIVSWFSKGFNAAMKWISNAAVWLWGKLYEGAVYAVKAIGNFIYNFPTYFIEAHKYIFSLVTSFYGKLVPYLVSYIVGFGTWLVSKISSFYYNAFSMAVKYAYLAVTQGIPYLYQKFIEFNQWLANAIVSGASYAFNTAMEYAYWAVTEGVPMLIGKIGEFLWWVMENVPAMIYQGFVDAFTWVGNVFASFFTSAADYFYKAGENLMKSIWEGLKSAWVNVKSWLQEVMSYATLGFVEGSGGTVQTAGATSFSQGEAGKIGNIMAQNELAKQRQVVNNTTNVQSGGDSVFYLSLDLGEGETLNKVVQRQQARQESRK